MSYYIFYRQKRYLMKYKADVHVPKQNKNNVRLEPGQNRVTWKTPNRAAFVPLQEPVAVLAILRSPHAKCRYEAIGVWSYTTFILCRSGSWDNLHVET
jgi:hypothetical protein